MVVSLARFLAGLPLLWGLSFLVFFFFDAFLFDFLAQAFLGGFVMDEVLPAS